MVLKCLQPTKADQQMATVKLEKVAAKKSKPSPRESRRQEVQTAGLSDETVVISEILREIRKLSSNQAVLMRDVAKIQAVQQAQVGSKTDHQSPNATATVQKRKSSEAVGAIAVVHKKRKSAYNFFQKEFGKVMLLSRGLAPLFFPGY
jgi:hypothetical protein